MPIDIKLSSCKKGPWKFRGRAASLKWFQHGIHGSRCPPLSCLSLISLDLAAAGPGWAEDWPKPARMQRTSRSSSMLVVVTHVCGWPHRSSCPVLLPKKLSGRAASISARSIRGSVERRPNGRLGCLRVHRPPLGFPSLFFSEMQ